MGHRTEADMRPGLHSTRTLNLSGRRAQRGVAAIEFALTVVLLLVIVFGIVSYGAMFWAQQKLSHLAGEGARYALVLSMEGTRSEERRGGKECVSTCKSRWWA